MVGEVASSVLSNYACSIMSLLTNAIKYSGANATVSLGLSVVPRSLVTSPTVDMVDLLSVAKAKPSATPRDAVALIWVRDNGQGLTPSQLSALFSPYLSKFHRWGGVPNAGFVGVCCRDAAHSSSPGDSA